MTKAIRIEAFGGPEVMKWQNVEVGEPGPGEIRVRHTAAGLNFLEIYQREGLYPLSLPSGLGHEGAGVVEAVGPDVSSVQAGDRIAYGNGPPGAYSEARLMPVSQVVKLPDAIDDRTAACIMLKGMTAYYLLHLTYPVRRGDTILVHAAAGGVGSLLVPWARHLGAQVIGTAGSAEKAERARAFGCHQVIEYRHEDVAARVREITGGRGVDVAYDAVGKATFEGSLDSLCPRGLMVSYGNASGTVPPVDMIELMRRGSLFITRPSLVHHVRNPQEMATAAHAVFDAVSSGVITVEINQTYAMSDAAQAHRDLAARNTTGCSVLLPPA